MQFRHLHASDLEGPIDLPGLREWIAGLTPRHAALLLLAPAGTGKTAAVGAIARHLGREVVLCNLLEVLDAPDNTHQLENLLIACETHPHHLVFLDKLDGFLEAWDRQHPDATGRAASIIGEWLRKRKDNLLAAAITVIFVGRDARSVPDTIVSACDQKFAA
jgi:ATPase family associated with various cellular activities (AAA)